MRFDTGLHWYREAIDSSLDMYAWDFVFLPIYNVYFVLYIANCVNSVPSQGP